MTSLIQHTTKTTAAFLTALAITLTAWPVSVFAQTEASLGVTEVSDFELTDTQVAGEGEAATTSPTTETLAAPASSESLYADTYRKEFVPNPEEVFNDFVVGPGKFELELAPGQSKTVELLVTNRMGERKLFQFTTEDAEGSATGETSVSLLGERTGPYTIKDFVSVPYERFYLEHGQRARVPVTISIPLDAEPGGRYGSLLTQITSNPEELEGETGAAPASVIVSRIGTLFFVTTPGETDQAGQLIDFTTKGDRAFFLSGPIDFAISYENTGSVHLNAYGVVTISNILGEEVGTVQLDPWFILPQSLRTREITWNRDFLIGRYTATLRLNRGYDDLIDEATVTFWVFPWKVMAIAFAGIFIFFLIIRFFFSRFEFKRK